MMARQIPEMTPEQRAEARTLAQILIEKFADDEEVCRLGFYLLGMLEQNQRLAAKADPLAARFGAPGRRQHRYPELEAAGLGHLWRGPGFNDFDEQLISGTQKFLKARPPLPAERGDAINAVRNKIREADWGYLEQRWQEGQAKPVASTAPAPLAPRPKAEPWKPMWEVAGE